MQTKSPKLGVVYDANSLKTALNSKPTKREYVSVGLIFKEIVEKEIVLETLYFNNKKDDAFSSKPLISNNIKKFISNKKNSNVNGSSTFENVSNEGQMRIKKESNFQFWDVMNNESNSNMKPLVYFSRNDLELLLAGEVKTITFSGAQVDYGIGLRDFEKEAVDSENKSAYPTLKAESNLKNNKEGALIPNVVLALPCPPIWEDDGDDTFSHLNKELIFKISDSVEKNFIKYKEKMRSGITETREMVNRDLIIKNLINFLS